MKQHMIFFDIDGTLIDEKTGVIPESTVRAIRQARKKGHRMFLCTGRCQIIIPKEVRDIGFDGVVAGCGTQIVYQGEELLHAQLEPSLQREIAEDLVKYHIDGVLEGKEASYFRRDYWMPVVKAIFEENGTFSPICQSFWEDELAFDKMALWFDDSSDMGAFKRKYEDRFEFILRDPTFYEVVPKGYSKATGIRFLCDKLGIPKADTIGIGDSTNDLPMLRYTGISIAMGSGNPAIFPEVDYVTSTVVENGIEEALKQYNII
ncbi:MAG: HAD family hydrolase [Lachnospiraceae bacterium]|nr:HAD family hydrolase [Lachnospiraceae bacterium]